MCVKSEDEGQLYANISGVQKVHRKRYFYVMLVFKICVFGNVMNRNFFCVCLNELFHVLKVKMKCSMSYIREKTQ